MNGRPELELAGALAEALRPLIREVVAEELECRLAELEHGHDEREYLTTAEYARRFKTTPDAVGARIRRRTLRAIRPPGSREWLIPVDDEGYDAPQ